MSHPVVSVLLITYNHERFIRQAIESVLSQVVDFPIEVIISDDTSSDRTWEIVTEYKDHPWVSIRQNPREDVIYIQGHPTGRNNLHQSLLASKGEFVAYLDGDDYWTDRSKLQQQVDALRAKPWCSMCFHPVNRLYEASGEDGGVMGRWHERVPYRLSNHLCHSRVPMASVVWRRSMMKIPFDELLLNQVVAGDFAIHAYCLDRGPGVFLRQTMACYRIHSAGVFHRFSSGKSDFREMGIQMRELLLSALPARRREILRGIASTRSAQVLDCVRGGDRDRAKELSRELRWRDCPLMPRYALRFVSAKLAVRLLRG